MKKFISILIVSVIALSGCSLLEEANDSLNYANEATEYMNELSTFAEEAPSLEGAELKTQLESLQTTIEDFMEIEPPSIAEGLHKELENKSQVLLDGINNVLENGEVAIEQLKQSEIYETIENITTLKKQIEELGL
ncbi:DUF6376 family protein [Virgibacillus doumboii]|uniref:DUF6376 family protein n=1 Tax=Virgibacillus doumboii TaxID=2697503 RepID=UPI0013E0254A|nr:DUF6376 family protein [Virgibacillus doumboii]